MANYRLVFAVLFVVLVFGAAILLITNLSKNSTIDNAEMLGGEVRTYLRLADYRCRAAPDEFAELAKCLEGLNEEMETVGDIEEEDFEDYDTETNETGYIIIVNDGRKSLESSKFTLLKNREVVDEGCAIPGAIDQGYTCKLTFNSTCEKGDVLEARYDGNRAYIKTC